MCRLLAAAARGPRGVEVLRELVRLHYEASARDPLLAALTGGDGRHCHGYGYALLVDYGLGWEAHYARFDAAEALGAGEESCIANLSRAASEARVLGSRLEGARRALLVLHSRRASRGTPRGTAHAHPYPVTVASEAGPATLYLAHNGSVHKEPLAGQLGVDPEPYTDSNLLALWIAGRLREGATLEEALREGARWVKRAYVVAALLHSSKGPVLAYASTLPRGLDERRRRYYKPALLEGEGLRAMASPTIARLAQEHGLPVDAEEPQEVGRLH